jgi:hypothetical protein
MVRPSRSRFSSPERYRLCPRVETLEDIRTVSDAIGPYLVAPVLLAAAAPARATQTPPWARPWEAEGGPVCPSGPFFRLCI